MRKLLVFDADNSMASIGDVNRQTHIFGTKPVRCTSLHKLRDLLVQLVDREVEDDRHEMFEGGTGGIEGIEFAYTFNDLAKANGLWGIAVDTWSHMSSKSMASIVYKAHGEPFPFPIDMGCYGTLGQLAGSILRIIENANFPVIVNSHTKEQDAPTGKILLPDMVGAMRKRLPEAFDIVLYADKKKKNKQINYIWHTRGSGRMAIAKVRLPEVRAALDDQVPQDLNRIITLCEKAGKPDPKILILADTGYGKTSALATINGLVAPHFNNEIE